MTKFHQNYVSFSWKSITFEEWDLNYLLNLDLRQLYGDINH